MLVIRLSRFGKKGYATYRIVVKEKRSKRDGEYIEAIGTYNPNTNPSEVNIKADRFAYWVGVGAQLSTGVAKLKNHLPKAESQSESQKEEVAKPSVKKTAKKKSAKTA